MTVAGTTDKRRPFDPATRKKRAKKVYDTAPVKGRDANRFEWYDAFREANLPLATKALGFTLSTYGNRSGDRNFPGLVRLAANLGLDERTVRTNLTLLATAGWIRKTSDYAQGPNRIYADVYQLTIPDTFVSSKPPKGAPEMPEWAREPGPAEDEPEEVDWIPETGSLDTGIQPSSHLSNNRVVFASGAGTATPGPGGPWITADAATDEGVTESRETERTKRPSKRKPSQVTPESRAECNRYIALIPRLGFDAIGEALDALYDAKYGIWEWAHDEMRKQYKEPTSKEAEVGDPETLEKARFMMMKALRCSSRNPALEDCLTDPLDAVDGA